MMTNQNGNEGVGGVENPAEPTMAAQGLAGIATELADVLLNAAISVNRLALECEKAFAGSVSAPEPSDALRSPPAAVSLIREARELFRTLEGKAGSREAKAMADKLEAWLMDHEPDTAGEYTSVPVALLSALMNSLDDIDGGMPASVEDAASALLVYLPEPAPIERAPSKRSDAFVKVTIWGDPIPVDGKRPEWLRLEPFEYQTKSGYSDRWYSDRHREAWASRPDQWAYLRAIRLPASHPYYLATSRGFTYWPGGESAPGDWDGNAVLARNGRLHAGVEVRAARFAPWEDDCSPFDIIGYHRKPEDDGCTCGNDGTSGHDLSCPRALDDVVLTTEAVREAVDGAIADLTVKPGNVTFAGGIGSIHIPDNTRFEGSFSTEAIGATATEPPESDPRAPLMAEVDKISQRLKDWRAIDPDGVAGVADTARCVIEMLAGQLIEQDERMLRLTAGPQFFAVTGLVEADLKERYESLCASFQVARMYDEEARHKAADALDGLNLVVRSELKTAVDTVATALGLQRATIAPPES